MNNVREVLYLLGLPEQLLDPVSSILDDLRQLL